MTKTNIAAYTEATSGPGYVAYVSINRDGDRITLTARERGENPRTVQVAIPAAELRRMAWAIVQDEVEQCVCRPEDSCAFCDPGG